MKHIVLLECNRCRNNTYVPAEVTCSIKSGGYIHMDYDVKLPRGWCIERWSSDKYVCPEHGEE